MSVKTRTVSLLGAAALLSGTAVAAAVVTSGSASGPAGVVETVTGGRIDTPSGRFLPVVSRTFTAASGPIVVRFAGEGLVEDWNDRAGFVGKKYAAMKVRVLLDGVPMEPGAGHVRRQRRPHRRAQPAAEPPRPCRRVRLGRDRSPPPASHTVTVEFRNLHTWDSATLLRWTLTVQHA